MIQQFDIGKPCTFNGENWVIEKFITRDKVLLKHLKDGVLKMALLTEIALIPDSDPKAKPLELISDKDWRTAQNRFAVLQSLYSLLDKDSNLSVLEAMEQIASSSKVSQRTIFRWKKLFESSGQISALVPYKSSGGRGKTRLGVDQERLINETVLEYHFRSQQPKAKKSYKELLRRCKKQGIAPPSENTFRSRISHLSQKNNVAKREGRSRTNQMIEPVPGNYPDVKSPLEVVQIDHTPLDLIVVSEDRKPIGRPWLTLGVDLYSRMVTGFYISFDSPGTLGTGICIANSILPKDTFIEKYELKSDWPIHGRIHNIHSDNAPEFKSKTLLMACQEYGINLNYRGKGRTHWGGHIERLLGTFLQEIHLIPGTTFSNTKYRENYDSSKEAALTLSELEKWIHTYIVDVYHQSIHSALKMAPIIKYYDGVDSLDTELPSGLGSFEFDPFKVKIDFLPAEIRTIQRTGVQIDHIRYYGDIFRSYINSTHSSGNLHLPKKRTPEKFVFKRDPRDISCIYFLDPRQKQYIPIYYANSTRPPMSIWEHREVLRELKKRGKIDKLTEEMIFEAYDRMDEIVDQAKKEKRLALRTERKKKVDSFKIKVQGDQSKDSQPPQNIGLDFGNIQTFTYTEDL